jgi:hypothetical protein
MVLLIQVVRGVVLLVLAAVVTLLIIAIARPESGPVEKASLVALIAVLIAAGARVASLAHTLKVRAVREQRLRRWPSEVRWL